MTEKREETTEKREELGGVELGLLTRLLPLAVLISAIVLFASELMTTFEFTPQGGEVQLEQQAADRHGNALMVVAAFAVIALVVAVLTGSKPAATAVAVAGVVALLIFLLLDLPDANATGNLENGFIDAEAVPREGFYMELLGALALTVTGVALATMTSAQLLALRPGRRKAEAEADEPQPEPEPESPKRTATAKETEEEPPTRRSARRARTRQRR